MSKYKTAKQMARHIIRIGDLNAWLGDESGKDADLIMAMRAGDDNAQWMYRCVMDNDAHSLRHAAESILSG